MPRQGLFAVIHVLILAQFTEIVNLYAIPYNGATVNYLKFTADCALQDVELYPDLSSQTNPFDASAAAGEALRGGVRRLADRKIDVSKYSGPILDLATIINTTVLPADPGSLEFPASRAFTDHCPQAEPYFSAWLGGLEHDRPVGGQIIIDDQARVVAVRKAVVRSRNFGANSALLLRNVTMGNGIGLPPGALIYPHTKRPTNPATASERTRIVPVSEVLGISF